MRTSQPLGAAAGAGARRARRPGWLILGYHYLAWTRTEFFFDDAGDFRLDSGVLQRNERRVALSRLQSVDVVKPLLGRIVGLAQVRIEVAGAGDSRVLVSYLTETEAHALRAEIIARAAGVARTWGRPPRSCSRRCRPATWP